MYTGARRATRPMPGGGLLEFNGDVKSRQMTDVPVYRNTESGLQIDYETKKVSPDTFFPFKN